MDYELEYNTRLRVPTYRESFERWSVASLAHRQGARCTLDQAYGPGERQRYDVFHADDSKAPLMVYFHGGYWQLGRREDVAFVARGFTAVGIEVVIPSYSLCPEVSVLQIVDELRGFLAVLWAATGRYPTVVGHSAGGQLAAALLATDWGTVPGVPGDLVRAGCALSGVFELEPLIGTSINAATRLDVATARAASPVLWAAPVGRTFVAAVGSDESAEFHRQSRTLADVWGEAGVATDCMVVDGANHYTILDALARPGHALFERVVSLVRRCS